MPKRQVVIGMLGTQLDSGVGPGRWEKWRPTVCLGMQEDFLLDRLELLVDERRFGKLASVIAQDLVQVSPETAINRHDTYLQDAWDFQGVYATLHDFLRGYAFRPDEEDYYVHITTGTHVAQICLFLLTESRHLPARLIQTSPPRGPAVGAGSYAIIDLDLSKYDRIAARFRAEQRDAQSFLKA
ncbi:MAG TPA: RNA repair transcriptional activator RtcR family protein, partial [Xanthomonadaceae bacterium]|nr:RNA repair transcriptional activator RtcR family protein [Xanthomonadaceae bacterium]